MYNLLFRVSSAATQHLAKDARFIGGQIGMVGILHTWGRNLENDQVTFRYRATDTGQPNLCTLSAEEFIRRFLQHVLPKGFVKVRYFGFYQLFQRSGEPES